MESYYETEVFDHAYADDNVFIAENKKNFYNYLTLLDEQSAKKKKKRRKTKRQK